jgi:predicted transcriptional regulator
MIEGPDNKLPESKSILSGDTNLSKDVRGKMRELGIKTNTELLDDTAREYFNKASQSSGVERASNARAILNLQEFISPEEYREMLRHILTTPEAIKELVRKGTQEEKEVNSLSSRIKRLLGK